MTKHFCDKCGKECSAATMWEIHCDSYNTETYFHFEVCSECMLKFNKLFDSKAESEVRMSKTEETNSAIEYVTKLKEAGLDVENTVFLADIAKSLAMIADKLCGTESEAKAEWKS